MHQEVRFRPTRPAATAGVLGVFVASLVTLLNAQAPAQPTGRSAVTFANDIQPILESNCWSCHGDTMRMSKLDLRTREAAMTGGANGAVLMPGNAEQSRLYQLASAYEDTGNTQKDAENKYLWRFRPQRLDAEIVRDAMLAVGGNLNEQMFGEPIFPYVPKEVLTSQLNGKWNNMPDGPAVWRRSVYVYRRRSLPYPMFDTFDHPNMNVTAGARDVTTVPTQALTLLNNPFVLDQAKKLADLVCQQASDPVTQINFM